MKTCTIEQLITQNFNVIFINALKQFWRSTKTFKCIGMPKNQNLLLFLNGCSVTYNDKNGKNLKQRVMILYIHLSEANILQDFQISKTAIHTR